VYANGAVVMLVVTRENRSFYVCPDKKHRGSLAWLMDFQGVRRGKLEVIKDEDFTLQKAEANSFCFACLMRLINAAFN
jgi:hypothetical protein